MPKFLKYRFSKKAKERAEMRVLQVMVGILLGLVLAGVLVVWQIKKDEARTGELEKDALRAQIQQVPPATRNIGGPFTLTNQNGKTVTDVDYRGKYLLIYFGYTYCPDVCPTGLQSMAHALDQLGKNVSKVQGLYVTIDPARDTPVKLKEYTASFHPDIVGLTGTPSQIAAVAKAYQVFYKKGEQVDEQDYLMDHSSLIYLMGPDGKFISTFPDNVDPELLVKAVKDQGDKPVK